MTVTALTHTVLRHVDRFVAPNAWSRVLRAARRALWCGALMGSSTLAMAQSSGITVRAWATLAANVGPQMELRVNGTVVASAEVRASSYQDYSFPAVSVPAGAKVEVVFNNDAFASDGDRNLFVESITVNGGTMAATAAGVVFDRGPGAQAFDGVDVMPGLTTLYWNGALRFQLPTGSTTPPVVTPPVTTDTPPAGYSRCASEWENCSFTGTASVVYGARGTWTSPRSFTGGTACTNAVFGDPLSGTFKACYMKPTASTPTPLSLNLSITGTGGVGFSDGSNCSASCSKTFNSGSTVNLAAAPSPGYTFAGWGGACSGTSTTCTVTMDAAKSVSATFTAVVVTTKALTVTLTGTGSVNFPDGSVCNATCTKSFNTGSSVTVSAAPATGFTFAGWGGVCSGTGTCAVTMDAAKSVSATFNAVATPGSGAPVVLYTDAVSGPIAGGEGNQGAYLSIFGKNFGAASGMGSTTKVLIGNCEVANYRYLGSAKVGAKLGIQQLTVQVGGLCNPALGQALPVKVTVAGQSSNADNTFMPNPGRILFVALNGNDATAAVNDITKPWRTMQTPARGGAYATLRAGDHIVIRGGNWSDIGFETAWLRFRDPNQMGSVPSGASGTGWIHITAYPGPIAGNAIEDVHYSTPSGAKGGIHGPASGYYGTTGEYVSISNLRMDVNATATSDAAPINLQSSGGNWRVVNNELGPWPATINSKGGGVSGHGTNVKVLGNRIYGMACTGALENHGIYADSGASNWEIGYNWIHDITGGNLIQFFDNVGLAGNNYVGLPSGWQGFTGMQVHHNWMENSGKYGLNLAPGIVSGNIWNNVVIGATYSGLRIDTISKNMNMTVAFNTFYDNDRLASGSGNGQVLNTWGNYGPTGTIRIYNNIFAAGTRTIATSSFYVNAGNSDAYLDFKRNLYWANGYPGWAAVTRDPLALYGDPKFTAPTTKDLSIRADSAALNAATQPIPFVINNDFTGVVARPQGSVNDIGAYERLP